MKLITINSNHDYFVYGTSYTQNNANEDAQNKLNLNPATWTKTQVHIKAGIATYPAEIKDWDTVKALVKAMAITISDAGDGEASNEDTSAVSAVKDAAKKEHEEKAENKRREAKKKIMSDLGDSLLEKAVNENVEKN